MALSKCMNWIDETGQELVEHGTVAFPIACYHDNLSKSSVEWHWHEELELILVSEGCARIVIDGEQYIVEKENGFFINSGVLHGCWNYGKETCRFHSIVFHPRLIGGEADSIFWNRYLNPVIKNANFRSLLLNKEQEWQEKALDAIENAWQACAKEEAGYEFQARHELSKLVALMSGHLEAQENAYSEKKQKESLRMKQMLEFINQNYAENITIKEISGSAKVSESECLRCFKNTIGTTPIQYLKSFRIKKAAVLLSNTDRKIVDIGIGCGFQDMSYFAKTFRQVYGDTPSEYRKKSTTL